MFGDQGRILLPDFSERKSFFVLINVAPIKEIIFCSCCLGLIGTPDVETVTSISPDFYVTFRIKGQKTAECKSCLVTYRDRKSVV